MANDKLKCDPEVEAEGMSGHEIVMMVLVRPFTFNLEPICLSLNMYIVLIYSLLYIWFESFPIVFIGIYGFSLGTLGLAFLGLLVGSLIVLPPFFWWVDKYLEPRFNENGELHPELRMIPAMVGAFFIPVCLLW
jgi:MFS transporter, DHA1 family, multidrug resistance protein